MIRPLYDRILVQPEAAKEVSSGGIIIPGTAQEKPQQARVVSTGTGRISDTGVVTPLIVKEGNTVLFSKYSGTEVKYSDSTYLMIREEDVLAIID